MGAVFTAEEIEQGHVPTVEDLERALEKIRERLVADPYIIAALFLGSVVRGDFNRRSDIDCAVLYEAEHETEAMASLQAVSWECKEVSVTVNFIPCDSATARSGMHHFGPGFIGHLENSAKAGGTIKGDVVSHLAPGVSREEEVTSYVRSKLYNLEEAYTQYSSFSSEKKASYLKKILEAPMHVARKFVGRHGQPADDSKRAIRDFYALMAPAHLSQELEELIALDAWYTAELEAQLVAFDRVRYEACLARIEAAIPRTVAFVRANALLIDEEQKRDTDSLEDGVQKGVLSPLQITVDKV